jgi:hypothetical protein
MNNLVKRSDELHKKAAKLLNRHPFRKLAEKHFGNITYTGSYVFNAMMDPDIDSNIIHRPIDKRKIIAFADDLTDIKECRKVILYNRIHETPTYFVVNVERFIFKEETWTLTFFIQEEDFQDAIRRNEDLRKRIDSKARIIILELKDWRIKNNLKADIPSVLLYEAVLDKGVKNVDDFKLFIKEAKPSLMI